MKMIVKCTLAQDDSGKVPMESLEELLENAITDMEDTLKEDTGASYVKVHSVSVEDAEGTEIFRRDAEETITITKEEYDNLVERDRWLSCLEAAGVDNWEEYDIAHEIAESEDKE